MRTEELMQNDWVRLEKAPIFCKVRSIMEGGHILGETGSCGHFDQLASRLVLIDLTQDTILCTTFWMKSKGIFKKTVRGVAAFTYDISSRLLTVINYDTNTTNVHRITFMHELQQQYRHYTCQELEVNMQYSKRKEYSKRYNDKKRSEV